MMDMYALLFGEGELSWPAAVSENCSVTRDMTSEIIAQNVHDKHVRASSASVVACVDSPVDSPVDKQNRVSQ